MLRSLLKGSGQDHAPSQDGATQEPSIFIILACCFIMLVSVIAWFALDKIKEKIQADAGDALRIVLQTTRESLNMWVESHKFQLNRLAEDPHLVLLAEQQLQVTRNKASLLESKALSELRNFFRSNIDQFGNVGFFIISPDFINIASMRDNNMGSKNLIANQALDILNRAFQGETLMVHPIWSDVPLKSSSGSKPKSSPTMFFAAPVKNSKGTVIAVVTQRVDPAMDFSRLIQLGRIGKSGETYAFGQYGKLLSESRFDEDLVKAGLIDKGQQSILAVSVRDPGGDLTKGFTPAVPRYQQPLTLMAREATNGHSGLNVAGYRDYRGVRVYGSWLWDDKLGIGLTTEIDEADALGPYYITRTVILTVLGITVLLALGSLVLAVLVEERAGRALKKSHDELEVRVEERTAELSQSEERFSLAVKAAGGGLWDLEPQTGKVWYSERFKLLLGYSRDEPEDSFPGWENSLHPDERDDIVAKLENHLETRAPFNEVCRLRCKTGEYRWYRTMGQALWDDAGRAYRMAGSIVDITEGRLAQEQARKLSRATENSPASVVITAKDGTIEYVNPTFCSVTGYSVEEAVGNNPRVLKSGNLPESFYKNLWDTILSGKTWRGDFHNKKKNGEEYWESASISPIKNEEHQITHFVAVKQDITERKRMERELLDAKQAADDANKAKGDFLANMSHEIRTPMNAVIGMAHLALKTELSPKQRDYLRKIQSSANSLLGIINDILDFSKIEAGKMDIESVDFNLEDVMDNLANLITVKAQEKENLEILFKANWEVPRFLVGDPLRLGQVLLNLANNAVKFTETGEIVVEIEKAGSTADRVTLKFAVSDTGIGMTEKQMTRLFQSFSQADTSTTRKFGGTGLGLAISKKLVKLMGGEIWVESELGQGTTFFFTANFDLGKEKAKKRFAPLTDLRGLKALVVDDNATSREIFRDLLESFSFNVVMCASGEEALTEFENAAPDAPFELVIMDWKMPGMDGIETAKRIKGLPDLTKKPAILMVTAYGREEIMQKAEKTGMDGFLLKPVNPSILFDAIMQAFGKDLPETSRVAKRLNKTEELEGIHAARILLVEDNEINQQVAKEILEGAGLHVTLANNGLEAVEAVKRSSYDAVLMDVQMPVLDGYEATKKIREWEGGIGKAEIGMRNGEGEGRKQKTEDGDQRTAFENTVGKDSDIKSQIKNRKSKIESIPIIAMTAHAMASDVEKSLDAGMNGHVTKPIDPDQLFAELLKWILPTAERIAALQDVAVDEDGAKVMKDHVGEALPDTLPGFNIAEGMGRLRGNKRLYRKLLLDFATKYVNVAEEIRDSLDAKDMKKAHSLVHNIKGLAGNLAATDLQKASGELEKVLKGESAAGGADDLNRKFVKLKDKLNQALNAVQQIKIPDAEKLTEPNQDKLALMPTKLTQAQADRIRAAAEMGDISELNSIAEKLKSESDALVPFCDKLLELGEDFDIDGIQKLIVEFSG